MQVELNMSLELIL